MAAGRLVGRPLALQLAQPLDDLPQQLGVGGRSARRGPPRGVDPYETGVGQIAEQHAYDGQGQVGVRGELDEGPGR